MIPSIGKIKDDQDKVPIRIVYDEEARARYRPGEGSVVEQIHPMTKYFIRSANRIQVVEDQLDKQQ